MIRSRRHVQRNGSTTARSSIYELSKVLFALCILPFGLIAASWRRAIAVGYGLMQFVVDSLAAMLGISFVLFVGYCLARALLYPLFQR